jgi:hypothetical protein
MSICATVKNIAHCRCAVRCHMLLGGHYWSNKERIRALSAASAAKFNITPVRWQHPSHVAIVPTESKGKTEGNDWDTACGNFKT